MNGPAQFWKDPQWWTKTIVQGIVLFNSLYHKNIDPNVGVGAVSALEAIFHAGQSLIQSSHAIKDGMKSPEPPKP